MSKIKFFPVSFFSISMGMSGYAILINKLSEINQIDKALSLFVGFISSIIFTIILIVYITKILKYSVEIKKEYEHQIKRNFIPSISISFLLQSILYININPLVSEALWIIGTVLQLILGILIINSWLFGKDKNIENFNPAWFIPAVGNLIVPVSGFNFGYNEISWMFLSAGLMFWMILFTIFIYRSIFFKSIPDKFIPTLFILIAPPSIATISLSKINAPIEILMFLYGFSVFMALIVLTNIKKYFEIKFFLSWWAYSFPIAALSIASIVMYKVSKGQIYLHFANITSIVLLLLIIILIIKTSSAIARNQICIEE